jgi:3'-phosphoadenosine 5'-phosphosulfate sulfotransferase (PAPS reductase)/FAD synthetase
MTTFHCFFSGGRDSALACFIAYQVTRQRGWHFVLVHIDTTVSIRQTKEYVKQYAEWLGAELVTLRPEKTFREYATQYGMWPGLYPQRYRWCYFKLKLEPVAEYMKQHYKAGDLVVLGVRGHESKFRLAYYTSAFFTRDYDDVKALIWAPLWNTTDDMLERLIRRYNIPRNPVWRYGFSGECLCLAGMPEYKIGLILRNFPEESKELLEIDRIINSNRRSGKKSAPFRLAQKGFDTLREYYEYAISQTQLDAFIYPYASCEGSCML